jgi:hypothetical protein
MTPDQVNLLIQQWHDALAEKLTDTDEIAEIRQLPAALRRTLRLRPALRHLTTNPLLCSMICALHRDSRENLPNSCANILGGLRTPPPSQGACDWRISVEYRP